MSSTRLTLPTKTPLRKSFFTMAELIAVVAITAILLTITIKVMKTDATKANSQVIGSALSYAKALSTSDIDDDQYAMVIIDADNNMVYVKKYDIGAGGYSEDVRESKLAAGSRIIDNTATTTNFIIGFNNKGEPVKIATANHPSPLTDHPTAVNIVPLTSQETILLTNNSDSTTRQTLRVKAFTGKITYY